MQYSCWSHQQSFVFCSACRVRSRDLLEALTSDDFHFWQFLHVWSVPHFLFNQTQKCDVRHVFMSGVFSGYENMTHWVAFFVSISFLLVYSIY